MKKVLIATLHSNYNYGAVLQAYALQQKVKQLGADCEIIDFKIKDIQISRRIFKPVYSFNSLMRNVLSVLFYPALKGKHNKFEKFINANLRLTKESFTAIKEIEAASLKADIFLTGSDQAWNYTIFKNQPVYFFPFIKDSVKAAYAASFGGAVDAASSPLAAQMSTWLKDYKTISVRDETSSQIVAQLTGHKPQIVLDPVFLLDTKHWDTACAPVKPRGKYIFFYIVKNHKRYYDMARKIAAYYKLPVVTSTLASKHDLNGGFKLQFNTGPAEFITLIKNAELVITSSFHGTIFSILYGKPFIAFDGKSDPRLSTLLSQTGLEDRAATLDNINTVLASGNNIDFKSVKQKLDYLKEQSVIFLKDVLGL